MTDTFVSAVKSHKETRARAYNIYVSHVYPPKEALKYLACMPLRPSLTNAPDVFACKLESACVSHVFIPPITMLARSEQLHRQETESKIRSPAIKASRR